MKAFVCVYRQPTIFFKDRERLLLAAKRHPLLHKFETTYGQANCFYDWGDDPGFFAASELLGHPKYASWGVCRADVRRQLQPGDLVIFFCCRQSDYHVDHWEYFYIGYGTVKISLDREAVWLNQEYALYKSFFNLLVQRKNGRLTHYEPFGEPHMDWANRIKAGYILFEHDDSLTSFNLIQPIKVATFTKGVNYTESWLTNNPLVQKLQQDLFMHGKVDRRLRTSHPQRPHRHIALHRFLEKDTEYPLLRLRDQLTNFRKPLA